MSTPRVTTSFTEEDINLLDLHLVYLKERNYIACHVCKAWWDNAFASGHIYGKYELSGVIHKDHLVKVGNVYYIIPNMSPMRQSFHTNCRELFKLCPPLE